MLDCHPLHPWRPPSWRSGRARELLHARLGYRRFDDAWVRRTRRFLAALDRRGGDLEHARVVAADPTLVGVWRLLTTSGARLRHEIEARLLANQTDAEIAAIVGVDAAVIDAFHAVRFDVRDKLHQFDWIASSVYGPRFYRRTGFGDEELAARYLGFSLGPVAVDVYFRRIPADARLTESVRLCVVAATAPIDDATAHRWVALGERASEVVRERADSRVDAVSGPLVPTAHALTSLLAAGSPERARVDRAVAHDVQDRRGTPVAGLIPWSPMAPTVPQFLRKAV